MAVDAHTVSEFPGTGAASDLMPSRTDDTEAFYSALDNDGRLLLQLCRACNRHRTPTVPVCPHCGAREFTWTAAAGTGRLYSWVRYHRPYLSPFASLTPYSVGLVELAEGPRMFGRLVGIPSPVIGMRVRTVLERWSDGVVVPAFGAAEEGE
ncbi:OB-fold domain-containing protein [Amycolatopsis acidiphila]|nr:OB-fold domain-containing protein [Amycolatopsis acidiphila]UIJ63372.1 OB-fold domain-containing protein [Amycolatopsis acidiphila]GHG75233.1 hypothetical protein GCM10017788_39970 [Amycolatopsis acidiphila]